MCSYCLFIIKTFILTIAVKKKKSVCVIIEKKILFMYFSDKNYNTRKNTEKSYRNNTEN